MLTLITIWLGFHQIIYRRNTHGFPVLTRPDENPWFLLSLSVCSQSHHPVQFLTLACCLVLLFCCVELDEDTPLLRKKKRSFRSISLHFTVCESHWLCACHGPSFCGFFHALDYRGCFLRLPFEERASFPLLKALPAVSGLERMYIGHGLVRRYRCSGWGENACTVPQRTLRASSSFFMCPHFQKQLSVMATR